MDYRERFERSVRQAWGQRLDITNILWAPSDTAAQAVDAPDWQRDALAYVMATAKEAAAGDLPPVQLDLDFGDRGNGDSVVLPFVSALVPIDARSTVERPFRPLEVRHVLDDSAAADGTVVDEITVSALGIVPAFDRLFGATAGDCTVKAVDDRGLLPDRFAAVDGEPPSLQTERTWRVTYEVPAGRAPTFAFPPILDAVNTAGMKSDYRRYAGSDAVSVGERVSLGGSGSAWRLMVLTGLIIACCIALYAFLRRKLRSHRSTSAASDT